MKKINFNSLFFVLIVGAITAFLWLPLLPVIVPLVTFALAIKWILTNLFTDSAFTMQKFGFKNLNFPVSQIPKNQAQPTAWPSLANLPSPARADSLPSLSRREKEHKSFRNQKRRERNPDREMTDHDCRRQISV